MNKYVAIIKKTLDEIIREPYQGQPMDLDEEDVLNIIAAVELAVQLIRLNPSVSGYEDFVRTITPVMGENEHVSKMAKSIYEYREITNE